MPNDNHHVVHIQTLVEKGFGLGYIGKKPVFVAKTIPDDVVNIVVYKKNRKQLFGRVINMITPSPLRTVSGCDHFPSCGGCNYQDISYKDQLLLKSTLLKDTIRHFLPDALPQLSDIIGCRHTSFHRNKMEFSFGKHQDKLTCGLKEQGSFDRIIPISNCQLLSQQSNLILQHTIDFFSKTSVTLWDTHSQTGSLKQLMIRHSKAFDHYVISIISATKEPCFSDYANYMMNHISTIIGVNLLLDIQKKGQRSTTTCIPLKGELKLKEKINELVFSISPQSFFQPNSLQVGTLYDVVKTCCDLSPDNTLLDLYCGTGTIGLYVCQKQGQLIGIEEVPQAIENAKENAALNHITNATFIVGRVKNILKFQRFSPDCIVIDPPRSGMVPKALQRVIDIGCKKIVYVSCNPVTLLRDLTVFLDQGYRIETFVPVDMFPHSHHLECVVKLTLN